eukprot:s88_g14.t1
MLSVFAKCLPKAIQQHVQLQLTESSTYSQVRAMVIGYERTTMTWSPGKIHSELGILPNPSSNASQPSSNMGLAPMEIDKFEKGKSKGKPKGKSKGKDGPKGKGKTKSDKGKGKSNKGSGRAATANDQCLHCGKYGHFKRDCWKLNGRPDTKNVNQVESSSQSTTTSGSSSATSAPASSVGGTSSVRLFTGYHDTSGPIIEDLDEDLDEDVEARDLTMYDSSGYCNMVSLSSADIPVESDLDTCVTIYNSGQYAAACEHFDMTCSDDDGLWTCCDNVESFSLHEPNDSFDFSDAHSIRTVGFSAPSDVEVVLDSFDFDGQIAERWMAVAEVPE